MKELVRATKMLEVAQTRVAKAFEGVKKQCEYRKQEEAIGFEGNEWFKCEHVEHPSAHSIYPFCHMKDCPQGT